MADSITFRGASVRYFDCRQEEGGAFVRIHMTAEFTKPVIEAMDWQDPGDTVSEAKLTGSLLATHFILTPGDRSLKDQQIHFDINSVSDFKVVTIERDESKHRELRFVVRSSANDVAALVDGYIRRIGDHQGALKVSYVKQEEMEFESGADTGETGCISCNNRLPFMDDAETKHVNGIKCTAKAAVGA